MKYHNLVKKIKSVFDENDIYTLYYIPPMIGFPIYIAFIVIVGIYFPENSTIESLMYFATTILFLLPCIGSIASIYKREMPWAFGKTYKGNWAVVSGVFGTLIFGFFGIVTFIYGISALFK